jgi:prophage antirepressor-like protein
MNLADVARTMGYKYTENLYRAHGWALREAQKIIDGGRNVT